MGFLIIIFIIFNCLMLALIYSKIYDDDFLNNRQYFIEMIITDEVGDANYTNALLENNETDRE